MGMERKRNKRGGGVQVPGLHIPKNGDFDSHLADTTRKSIICTKATWSTAERLFAGDFKQRRYMFDSLVKSGMTYGAEIWGWAEQRKLEGIQKKYLKWSPGADPAAPGYIMLEETKRDKISIEAGKRAVKFEDKEK